MEITYWTIVLLFLIISTFVFITLRNKKAETPISSPFKNTNIEITPTTLLPPEIPWNIKSYTSTDMRQYETPKPMVLSGKLKTGIDNIIKLTPGASDIIKIEKKVVVNFSEDVLNKLKTGELKLMKQKGSLDTFRTIAVDQNNIIRKHGSIEIKDFKKVNPTQLANAALGIMTVITAQEHLDKINKQLTLIDRKIDTLIRANQNERIGKTQGNIRYLKSILPEIQNMNEVNNQLYLIKIEDISLQCYQEIQSLLIELQQIINEISSVKEKTIYGVDKIVEEVRDLISTFELNLITAFRNLEVMSICLKIRNDIEENLEVNINRLHDIENDFENLQTLHNRMDAILKDKQLGLNATFRTNKAIAKRKEELKKQISYHNTNIKNNMNDVKEHIKQLNQSSDSPFNEPIDLEVEYDKENNITAVYKLKKTI